MLGRHLWWNCYINSPLVAFMPLSLFVLWSRSDKKLANFLWGFFFILVSHSWLFELHPLTWLGFSWISSLIISISIFSLLKFLNKKFKKKSNVKFSDNLNDINKYEYKKTG